MHRIGTFRPPLASSFSQFCRYSTETPTKLVTEWKGISIPSLTEVKARQKQAARKKSLDISYLKDAPKTSLAGILARRADPLPKPVAQTERVISKESIDAVTQKRREARIAREKQKTEAIFSAPSNPAKSTLEKIVNAEPSRPAIDLEEASLPKLAPWRPPPSKPVQGKSRRELPSARWDAKKGQKSELKEKIDEGIVEDPTIETAPGEYALLSQIVDETNFSQPEPVSNTLQEVFDISPRLRLSRLRKPLDVPVDGDYSLYVSKSIEANFSTPVGTLSPVDTASIALSHRADIAIPQRKHALSLIAKAATTRSAKVQART